MRVHWYRFLTQKTTGNSRFEGSTLDQPRLYQDRNGVKTSICLDKKQLLPSRLAWWLGGGVAGGWLAGWLGAGWWLVAGWLGGGWLVAGWLAGWLAWWHGGWSKAIGFDLPTD